MNKSNDTSTKLKNALDTLRELRRRNRIRNDLDAYLLALYDFRLGNANAKPDPLDYGINLVDPWLFRDNDKGEKL